jgi:hypothetical protein
MRRLSRLALGLFAAAILPGSIAGQPTAADPRTEDPASRSFGSFGGFSQDFWITAAEFAPFDSSSQLIGLIPNLHYWRTAPGGLFGLYYAPVRLPAGAQITFLRCDFYDDDAGQDAAVTLVRSIYNSATNTPSTDEIVDLETSGTNGYVDAGLAFDHTVRYRIGAATDAFYMLLLSLPDSSSLRFRGCRLSWNRQVSTAPATATFSDVPVGHPYHRFVEALASSGITAGCLPSLYCVNNPITRGEMAVFLAAALGLHFPF